MDAPFSHTGKWCCTKCNVWSPNSSQRCGWCSKAKPSPTINEEVKVDPNIALRQELVNSIQRLNNNNMLRILKDVRTILEEQ